MNIHIGVAGGCGGLLCAAWVAIASTASGDALPDDVAARYRDERAGYREAPPREFFDRWSGEFLGAFAQHGIEEAERATLMQALVCSNMVQDCDQSVLILEELLRRETNRSVQVHWHLQISSAHYTRYMSNQSPANCERAIKAGEAVRVFVGNGAWMTPEERSFVASVIGPGYADMANMYSACRGDHRQAAAAYLDGLRVVETWCDAATQEQLSRSHDDREGFLWRAAAEYAEAGALKEVNEILDQLGHAGELRTPLKEYAVRAARLAFPERGAPFRDWLTAFDEAHASDAGRVELLYEVASSLHREAKIVESIAVYREMISISGRRGSALQQRDRAFLSSAAQRLAVLERAQLDQQATRLPRD